MQQNSCNGFTIVELMIAVAIIGIVSSIAIPAFNNYLKRSKASEAVKMSEAYKLAIAECGMSTNITDCDETNGNVQLGTNGKYGNIKTAKGEVIYNFTIDDISFRNHNVIFYVDNFDPYSTIKWSCKTSSGFDSNLLPNSLDCKNDDVVASNVFTNPDDVKNYFGGNPIINGVETNPRWFAAGSANVSYFNKDEMTQSCSSGKYICSEPYGNASYVLEKTDGTKITNLDQFCKDGAKGYIVNASKTDPSNAGLVCVRG